MQTFVGQTNFLGGELDPLILGRVDEKLYANGASGLTNMVVRKTGGASRRPGTIFVSQAGQADAKVRLIRFQPTVDDGYVIELGNLYMKVYKAEEELSGYLEYGGFTLLSNDGSNLIYSSSTRSTPWAQADLDKIVYTQRENSMYFACEGYPPYVLTKFTDLSWALNPFTPALPPISEQGTTISGVTLTYSATTGSGVTFTASGATFLAADVGRTIENISSIDSAGVAVIRSITSSTVVVADITTTFPTGPIAAGDWKIGDSPVSQLSTGSVASTVGSEITFTSGTAAFRAADVGSYITVHNGICKITAYNSSTSVTCNTLMPLKVFGPTYNWSLSKEDWTSTLGYPRTVTFFEQRLIFAGSSSFPHRVWASAIGLYDNFGVVSIESSSLSLDIAQPECGAIAWIRPGRSLIIGTSTGEMAVKTTGIMTASNPGQIVTQTTIGASTQTPISAQNKTFFVQADARGVQGLRYEFKEDGYVAEELFATANHLLRDDTILELCYTQFPESRIYALLASGSIAVCYYDAQTGITAWSKYTSALGTYESIAKITASNTDQVWVSVKRTINSATVRHIELFASGEGSAATDVFMDSAVVYTGSDLTGFSGTVTGLSHLRGRSVAAIVNGTRLGTTYTVNSSGEITLTGYGTPTSIVVGLTYTSTLVTIDREINPAAGTMVGQLKRAPRPILKVYRSTIPTLNGQTRLEVNPTTTAGIAMPVYSGTLIYGSTTWDNSLNMTIATSDPYPLNVLGIYGSVEGNQR